jgi:hypothetical protein
MPEMNQIERRLFQRISDDHLRTSLTLIRQATAAIWSGDAPRIIPGFTDHGLAHSQRLAGFATKLLKANNGAKPTSEELYLLVAGIYLHDIGMQCDVLRFPEVKATAERLGAQFDIQFTAATASAYSFAEQKTIRQNHQYLSAAWIDVAQRKGIGALGLAAKTIPEDLVEDLMDVCKFHARLPITDCPAHLQLDSTGRKQMVAALLRFADELDVDVQRVSIDTVKNFRLDPGSAAYWWLHSQTKVVFDAPNVVTLTIRLHPDDYKRLESHVYTSFINGFKTKNEAVLTVLARNRISITISADSKVIPHDHTKSLPAEIAEALSKMQNKVHHQAPSDLTEKLTPPTQPPAPIQANNKAKGHDGTTQPSQAQKVTNTGNTWAVLVGINTYEDTQHFRPLQVCVKDVEATREQLIIGGFDPARVRLLTDSTDEKPTRANILAALKSAADATEPNDVLVFYYSGHGDEAAGESYLVAQDGRQVVLGDTAIPVTRVKEIMSAAPSRAKVILLDACHSGADIGEKGSKPMTKKFIERVFEQATGMAILASCTQGQFSYEWRAQERSVFTHYLLEALKGEADRDEKGFVTVQDASHHVTAGVKLWASQHDANQTPTLQYAVVGDIILTRYAKSAQRLRVPTALPDPDDRRAPWLDHWKFERDPFESRNADNEDFLPQTFVVLPHVDHIFGPRNHVLMAERGAGKSATCKYVESVCRPDRRRNRALPVRYTDFSELLDQVNGDPVRISRHQFVEAILRAGIRVLADKDKIAPRFFDSLSHTDRGTLLSMARAFADSVDLERLGQVLLVPEPKIQWDRAPHTRSLDEFVRLVRLLGPSDQQHFESVYVLVDPVIDADETGVLSLLKQLANDGSLLRRPNLAFKFFLPKDVGAPLLVAVDPDRDRFDHEEITWSEGYLRVLMERRLSHFSQYFREFFSDKNDNADEGEGKFGLALLCAPDAIPLLPDLWGACRNSPRELLRLCEEILWVHVDRKGASQFSKDDIAMVLRSVGSTNL